MKYAIIKCSNGAFAIESEWSDITKAKVQFHGVCRTLWNAPDVLTAKVMIVDEQLNCVEGYREYIFHEPAPEPEPEPEPVVETPTEETPTEG
jgi:hypothetical protein